MQRQGSKCTIIKETILISEKLMLPVLFYI